MKKNPNKILEEIKNESSANLVSTTERFLRARIAFAEARLTLINGMILDKKEMKVKGVSPAQIQEMQAEFKANRESLVDSISKKYDKNPNLKKIVKSHSKSLLTIREGGYNI